MVVSPPGLPNHFPQTHCFTHATKPAYTYTYTYTHLHMQEKIIIVIIIILSLLLFHGPILTPKGKLLSSSSAYCVGDNQNEKGVGLVIGGVGGQALILMTTMTIILRKEGVMVCAV